MKFDPITKSASVLLCFTFLFPGCFESLLAVNTEQYQNWGTSEIPLNSVYREISDVEIDRSNSPDTDDFKKDISEEGPLMNINVFRAEALVSAERGKLGKVKSIYNFNIDEFHYQPAPKSFLVLEFEVGTSVNEFSSAISLNSNAVITWDFNSSGNQWQTQRIILPEDNLVSGYNNLRFDRSNMGLQDVSIRNLRISRVENSDLESSDYHVIPRVISLDHNFFQTIPFSENSKAFKLRQFEMPSIPSGVVNITKGALGLQPSASALHSFPEMLGVSFDNAKIINTSAGEGLMIFAFNYRKEEWEALEIDSIDNEGGIAFVPNKGSTQYFAGMLKTPEMPEASAFASTKISGIEAANPSSGINLISPPEMNQQGTASISYPLAIPTGRKGVQPNVTLNYSSDGAESWAGYGWSISIPKITIDTRWGVPTYDSGDQTEMYLLNGEALYEQGEKRTNRSKYVRNQSGTTYYYTKQTSSYREIIRHGTSVNNYWWEIIDASGKRSVYGVDPNDTHTNGSVLTDGQKIVEWGLSKTEDLNGNHVVYKYDVGQLSGSTYQNNIVYNGYYMYIDEIYYTGHENDLGKYRIKFYEDNSTPIREDARVNLNYGLKKVDHMLLSMVKVQFEESTNNYIDIKSFRFDFLSNTEEYRNKSTLQSLREFRSGNFFYQHDFEYFSSNLSFVQKDPVQMDHWDHGMFAELPKAITENNSSIEGSTSKMFTPSAVSSNSSHAYMIGGKFGLGLTPSFFKGQDKNLTVSYDIRGGQGFSKDKTILEDFNGDGIPDYAYRKRHDGEFKLRYYPAQRNGDIITLGADRNIKTDHLRRSVNNDFNAGYSIFAEFPGIAKASFGLNWNLSYNKQKDYLIDYNADGIKDLVRSEDGGLSLVHFGQIDQKGNISFNKKSSTSLNPVVWSSPAPTLNLNEPDPIFMEVEIVKIWTAPVSGTINISGSASLTSHASGPVEVAIQKDRNFIFPFTDVTTTSTVNTNVNSLAVAKDDTILFRTRSGDNSYEDLLNWNPQINYSLTKTDGQGQSLSSYNSSNDFLLTGGDGVTLESDRNFKVEWPNFNISNASDEVVFRIVAKGFKDDGDLLFTEIYSKTIDRSSLNASPNSHAIAAVSSNFKNSAGDGFGPLTSSQNLQSLFTNNNYTGDGEIQLSFEVFSTSNINWTEIDWRPKVLVAAEGCLPANSDLRPVYPTVNYGTYSKIRDVEGEYLPPVTANVMRVWPDFTASSVFQAFTQEELNHSSILERSGFLVVKSGQKLLQKIKLVLRSDGTNGIYLTNERGATLSSLSKYANLSEAVFTPSEIDETLHIEFYGEDDLIGEWAEDNLNSVGLLDMTQSSILEVKNSIGIFNKSTSMLLQVWKHWGGFVWNDKSSGTIDAINPSDLEIETSTIAMENNFAEQNLEEGSATALFDNMNALDAKFVPLLPRRGEEDDLLREYMLDNIGSSSVADKDCYSALYSHAGFYRGENSIVPWKLAEEDLELQEVNNPSGIPQNSDDFAFAAPFVSTSSRLSTRFGGGTNFPTGPFNIETSLSKDVLGSLFSGDIKLQMMDMNGDGFPDLLHGDDIEAYLTDPRGVHSYGNVNYASGRKQHTVTSMRANLALSNDINQGSGKFFSESPAGSLITDLANLGLSAVSDVGKTETTRNLSDINGDGLPDLLEMDNSTTTVSLNSGYSMEQGIQQTMHKEQFNLSFQNGLEFGQSFSTTYFTSIANTALQALVTLIDVKQKSFAVGLGIARPAGASGGFYLDLNGDGLQDYIQQTNDHSLNYGVYYNTGTGFISQPIAITAMPTYPNQSNNFSLTANVGATFAPSFPSGVPLVDVKLSITGTAAYTFSSSLTKSSFKDMNGDGFVDIVYSNDSGHLEVLENQCGKVNKLKRVSNPLGGEFVIDYELIGSKFGYYKSSIIGEEFGSTNYEYWDMPYSKYVMSELTISDGYNDIGVADNPLKVFGGAGQISFTYKYEAGYKSRRNKDFYGFGKIEKLWDWSAANHTVDYKNRDDDYASFVNKPNYTFNTAIYQRRFAQVKTYNNPLERGLDMDIKGAYKQGILKSEEFFTDYIVHRVFSTQGEPEVDTTSYIVRYPISRKTNEYTFYNVDVAEASQNLYQVKSNGSTKEETNWSQLGEEGSVFPALTKELTVVYPVFDTADVFDDIVRIQPNLLQATQFTAEYDVYFNVTDYDKGFASANNSYEDVQVGTAVWTEILQAKAIVHVAINTSNQTVTVTSPDNYRISEIIDFVPDAKTFIVEAPTSLNGYENDTLYIPNYLLVPNDCVPTNREYLEVPVYFKNVINHSDPIMERRFIGSINKSLFSEMDYFAPDWNNGFPITNMLSEHRIREGNSTASPSRRTSVNRNASSPWLIENIENHLGVNSIVATSTLAYDQYGNVTQITGPENHNAQRLSVQYVYDQVVHKYVEQITDSYLNTYCKFYDYGTGLLLGERDINGHPVQYEYDQFYRLTEVWGPRQIANSSSAATIRFEYLPFRTGNTNPAGNVPLAITYHNINGSSDEIPSPGPEGTETTCLALVNLGSRPAMENPLRTFTFVDGIGQVMQVKKEASYSNDALNPSAWDRIVQVSGMVKKDIYGRPRSTTIDFLEVNSTDPVTYLNQSEVPSTLVQSVSFDNLGRPRIQKHVTEGGGMVSTSINYFWENLSNYPNASSPNYLLGTETINPEGQRSRVYQDADGRQLAHYVYDDATAHKTYFGYSDLGELVWTQDPAELQTSYIYDNFGRMIQEIHPDRGVTTNEYDEAGNLIRVETPETGTTGISMTYDYNRIITKEFPFSSDINNLTYNYGAAGDNKNGAGRVVSISQGTNFKTDNYKYDELGNLVREEKTINIPQAGDQTYITKFTYDSWGRLREMIYPDGETVDYDYDLTGELQRIVSEKGGADEQDILSNVYYDGFASPLQISYGNGTETDFQINPYTRRVTNVQVADASQTQLLNKTFSFDGIGNVSDVQNAANAVSINNNLIGGQYHLSNITYDGLNQLESANMKFGATGISNPTRDLDITMNYAMAGRIQGKDQFDASNASNNYNFSYQYHAVNKHLLETVTDNSSSNQIDTRTYDYNDAGSITEEVHLVKDNSSTTLQHNKKNFCWNEDQTLAGVLVSDELSDVRSAHLYTYDHVGERVLKTDFSSAIVAVGDEGQTHAQPMEAPTVYVNPYYITTNYYEQTLASKHYYMGSQRISSELIAYSFSPDGTNIHEPPAGREGSEGEGGGSGGSTNTTYSSSEDAIIQSYERTLRCLYNDPEMTFDWSQNLNMQSIGGPIQMGDCNLSDPLPSQEAVCACEQSIYHANLDGHECYNYNIQYWYHPDYLGSVEFVTDRDGEAYQFFLNTPWGESLESHSSYSYKSFDSRYRFNGKELDPETGNYYYGARYYDPKTSIWLSVDPKAYAFPHHTPYNFMMNNPINVIDPGGDSAWTVNVETGQRNYVDDRGGAEQQIVSYINSDGHDLGTKIIDGGDFYHGQIDGGYLASGTNFWNSDGSVNMGLIAGNEKLMSSFLSSGKRSLDFKLDLMTASISNAQSDFLRTGAEVSAYALQQTGDIAALAGYGLTLTGVGAPIGIPLAMLGSVTSAAGGGIQAGLQFADGNVSGGLGAASMSGLSLIPGSRLIPSKTLGHHILNQGASLKISGINRLLNE